MRVLSSPALSTKIASLRSQRQRGVAEIVSSLFTPRKDNPFGCRLLTYVGYSCTIFGSTHTSQSCSDDSFASTLKMK